MTAPRSLILALVPLLALLLVVPAAQAACGDDLIADYLEDGLVDGEYTVACYEDALGSIDPELDEYSPQVRDDLEAGMNAIINRQPSGETTTSAPPPTEETAAAAPEPEPDVPVETVDLSPDGSDDGELTTEADGSSDDAFAETDEEPDETTVAAETFDDGGDDGGISGPVLVVGGLAVALIAVGGGGIAWRRFQSR